MEKLVSAILFLLMAMFLSVTLSNQKLRETINSDKDGYSIREQTRDSMRRVEQSDWYKNN